METELSAAVGTASHQLGLEGFTVHDRYDCWKRTVVPKISALKQMVQKCIDFISVTYFCGHMINDVSQIF
jgi:hypothetical protein